MNKFQTQLSGIEGALGCSTNNDKHLHPIVIQVNICSSKIKLFFKVFSNVFKNLYHDFLKLFLKYKLLSCF